MQRAGFVAALMLLFSTLGSAQTSTLPCSSNCTLAKAQAFSVVYDWAPTTLRHSGWVPSVPERRVGLHAGDLGSLERAYQLPVRVWSQ
jgi:hypothetical protein